MRRAKTASRARGPEALARVQRNALNALEAWEKELEKQLGLVRSQIGAISGPAASAAPAAPKRRRKTAKKKAAAKRGRKAAGKRTRKTAKKKTVKKAAKKAAKKTRRKVSKKPARKVSRKTVKRKTARKSTRKAAKKSPAGRRKKQTMIQAIVQLLKDKGRPLRPVEIAGFIKSEKRYPTKSKNVYNAVMTNLVRSKDVKKNKAGSYVLA